MLTETFLSQLSNAQTFEEHYGVQLIDVRIMNFVKDMMSSKFVSTYSRAAYKCYIREGKLMIKHDCVLSLFGKLVNNVTITNTIGITQHDNSSVYNSSEENDLLMN